MNRGATRAKGENMQIGNALATLAAMSATSNPQPQPVAGTYRLNRAELVGLRECLAGAGYPSVTLQTFNYDDLPELTDAELKREKREAALSDARNLGALSREDTGLAAGNRFNRPMQEPLKPLADILAEEYGYEPMTDAEREALDAVYRSATC